MRIDRSNITPAVILMLALTAACTKVRPGQDSSPAIGFSPAVTTRAMIESSEDPAFSAFDVRAYSYLEAEDGTPADPVTVFDGETVTRSGSTWTYDGTHYWTPGRLYDFYAVFPSGVEHVTVTPPSAAATEGTVSITDFDAREKGPDDTYRDLMLAVTKDRSYDPATKPDGPETVQMAFTHLLSCIDLECIPENTAGINDFYPIIYSAKLYGMSGTADFSSASFNPENSGTIRNCWTVKGTPTDSESPYCQYLPSDGTNGTTVENRMTLLSEKMVIPQTFTSGMMFEIEYATGTDDPHGTHTAYIDLQHIGGYDAWEAGKHYIYTFTISPEGYILFDIPEVIPWEYDIRGGTTIVD